MTKSTAIKKLQGTYEACKTNQSEPVVAADISQIAPPELLNKNAREIWKFAISQMPKGMISALDFSIFMRWCSLVDQYHSTVRNIDKNGVMIVDDADREIVNPAIAIELKLNASIKDLEKELGFTPVSRTKVISHEPEANSNPFLEL